VILFDVNVLIYAQDRSAKDHQAYYNWLQDILNSSVAFGLCDVVLSGFIRIVTHPRILKAPMRSGDALDIIAELRNHPNSLIVEPGDHHWRIFDHLCRHVNAAGNAVPDAYIAALAIESKSELVTADRGFARFPGLAWRHPLKP
jgi:toxin-antitoxin system PIN domain toxin